VIDATIGVFAFVFGAIVGSFLNVCIVRLPAGQSIVTPRSRCPNCAAQIAGYDNIPVVSWLLLRGRCRNCDVRISPLYPLIELATGGIWLAAFLAYGPTFVALRVAAFATILLGVALTDAREMLIPDGFTVFGIIWVAATSVIGWVMLQQGPFATPAAALLGACVGAGAIAIIGWLGEVALKREAMGFGDVTLMAVVGAAVGPERALLTIFIGALLAVPILLLLKPFGLSARTPQETDAVDAARHIPFGVFLAPAAVIALLWGNVLIRGYMEWVLTGSIG
jgi:leader peptidase (prepilin peptidase)/N-methyltransferase